MNKYFTENKTFIIAEAGVNHGGDLQTALQMIDCAAQAGADAVKFQTFKAETLVSPSAPKAEYQKETTNNSESQFEMLKKLELPESAYPELIQRAEEQNIMFLSTPFDEDSADFLDELGMKIYKIPSGELTNLPLLEHIAAKMKPVIISTGMANVEEIETALKCIYDTGNTSVILLQCTSNYPVAFEDVNLLAIQFLKDKFKVQTGFSDHTLGTEVAVAAVALGATVIEKHFTLDKTLPGPDHRMSLNPVELQSMIKQIRNVEKALGQYEKNITKSEADTASVARKSIFYKQDLKSGTILTKDNVEMKRPGTGISPIKLEQFIGKPLKSDVLAGTMMKLDDFKS